MSLVPTWTYLTTAESDSTYANPDLVTLVPSYASIRPDESGPHVGLTWTWHSAGPGTQLDRVALVPTRGSPDTGDSCLILCLTRT